MKPKKKQTNKQTEKRSKIKENRFNSSRGDNEINIFGLLNAMNFFSFLIEFKRFWILIFLTDSEFYKNRSIFFL